MRPKLRTLKDLHLSENDRLAIEEAARLLRKEFPVEEVVLFGSKAVGTDDPESDIDLLVLTSRKLSWRENDAITDALYDIQLRRDVAISTLVVFGREWREGIYSVLPIHDEVKEKGVVA